MKIRNILRSELEEADKLQQRILNPRKKKRYRTYNYIKRYYQKNPKLFVGAFDNKKIIGIIFGYILRNKVLLGEIAILKKYRNQSIGKKLISFFEKQCKKLKQTKIITGARFHAKNFYLKQGFKVKNPKFNGVAVLYKNL